MRTPKYGQILTKDFLTEHHVQKEKSPYQISKEVGCDNQTVTYYLALHKIPQIYRSSSHGRKSSQHQCWRGHKEISLTYWNNLKTSAKTRKIPFEISIAHAWQLYLRQNKTCALSGRPIAFEASKSNTASLDRIDSKRGYVTGNIQWVHRDLNFAKQSLSNEEFLLLCQEVVKFNGGKGW